MKRSKLLFLGLASILTLGLASCGYNEDENFCKQIVKKAAAKALVNANGEVISEDSVNQAGGKTSPSFFLTTKQTAKYDGQERFATVEWSWDDDQKVPETKNDDGQYLFREHGNNIVKQRKQSDETHDVMYVRYPIFTDLGESFSFTFKAKVSYKEASQELEYTVQLKRSTIQYDEMSMAELHEKNAKGYYKYLYEEDDGSLKISPNHEQDYLYITTKGVVTYVTPDKNFAILQNGEYAIELYQYGQCTDSQVINIGDAISVSGEVACYFGSPQLSFLSLMDVIDEKIEYNKEITEITVQQMTGANRYGAFDGVTHRVRTLKGVEFVGGSIRNRDGAKTDNPNAGDRFTFDVRKDGLTVTIAFDYHTNNTDKDVGKALKTLITSLSDGDKLNVTGWLRFSGPDTYSFSFEGDYQLIPVHGNDVVKA